MFDIEVDACLLGVDTDLDCIVYCPVGYYFLGWLYLSLEDNYRFTGTSMLSRRTAEGLILDVGRVSKA
jgi:hypothetical protein